MKKNSNLKEYLEFVPKELIKSIDNTNASAMLGMYISLSVLNHSNKVTVTNEQIRKAFKWQSVQIQRANSKLEFMKLISRNVSTSRGVPTEVTLCIEPQQTESTIETRSLSNTEESIQMKQESVTNETTTPNDTELLQAEIQQMKEAMKILHKGLKNLEEENGKLKQSMKILNNKMNILHKENAELKEELSELKDEISTLENPNTETNDDGVTTEDPRSAGNAPIIEENPSNVYSPISEGETLSETITEGNSRGYYSPKEIREIMSEENIRKEKPIKFIMPPSPKLVYTKGNHSIMKSINDFNPAEFECNPRILQDNPEFQDLEFVDAMIDRCEREYYTCDELMAHKERLIQKMESSPKLEYATVEEEDEDLPF